LKRGGKWKVAPILGRATASMSAVSRIAGGQRREKGEGREI
jgi:hypothetical protein